MIVSGVNMIKHTKPNPQMGQPGGIVEKEAPIQISNVAIYNAEAGVATESVTGSMTERKSYLQVQRQRDRRKPRTAEDSEE